MTEITRNEIKEFNARMQTVEDIEMEQDQEEEKRLNEEIDRIKKFVEENKKLFVLPTEEEKKRSIAYWEMKAKEMEAEVRLFEDAKCKINMMLDCIIQRAKNLATEAKRHKDSALNQKTI